MLPHGVRGAGAWVEQGAAPPASQLVPDPNGDVVNSCPLALGRRARGGPTVPGGRARRPRGRLHVTVSPRRDRRRPFRFRTRGRLLRPAGVSAAAGCRGTVTVQVKAGRRTISARRARVGRACRFSSRVTFRRAARLGRGRLKFVVRFSGNRAVAPGSARTLRVRARRRRDVGLEPLARVAQGIASSAFVAGSTNTWTIRPVTSSYFAVALSSRSG